ncbi:MAG TPA: STAS domain-containing protein [Pseudonocardiaceae bacterium]
MQQESSTHGGATRHGELLRFEIEVDGSVAVLRVFGEIDLSSRSAFTRQLDALLRDSVRTAVLDLRGITFFGSAGLAALVDAHGTATDRGVTLRVVSDSRTVLVPLDITGLAGELDIHPDLESALA